MSETPENRLQRQRGEHYRRVANERRRDRYALQPHYRDKERARAMNYYLRKTGKAEG